MKLGMMFAANNLTISTIRYSECSSVGSLLLGEVHMSLRESSSTDNICMRHFRHLTCCCHKQMIGRLGSISLLFQPFR